MTVVLVVYAVVAAFFLGLGNDARNRALQVSAAVLWPLMLLMWLGAFAADHLPIDYGGTTTDGTYAWAKGVRFTVIVGTKNARLYFARAPKGTTSPSAVAEQNAVDDERDIGAKAGEVGGVVAPRAAATHPDDGNAREAPC